MRRRGGWAVIWSVAVTELISWGVLIYAFSVLLVPMRDELGWSVAQLTGAYSLGILVSGLAAVPVGRWLDARGPRGLMTAGSVVTVLVLLAWSEVDSLALFYVVFALAGLAMAATLYEPAFAIAASWFGDRAPSERPRAVLILTVFGGLASVLFVPLCGVLVTRLGWRDALLVLAAIVAVVCVPIHALVVRRPEGARARPRGTARGRALRSRSFRWLAVCLTLSTLGRVAVSVHLVAYLVERGYALEDAALAGGGIGLLQVVGRVVATGLRTRIAEHVVFSGFLLLQGLSVSLLLATAGRAMPAVIAFVLIYGMAFGLPELMRGVLVADFYGTEHYARINGALALFVTSARAIAPVAAGASRTLTGSYTAMLVTAGAAAVLSAGALLAAHRAHAAEAGLDPALRV